MDSYFVYLMTSTDKLMDILEQRSDIIDRHNAEELFECNGEIEFDDGPLSSSPGSAIF